MAMYRFHMKKSNRKEKGKQIRVCPLAHYLYITRQGDYSKLGGLVGYANLNMDKITNLAKDDKGKDFWKGSKELESIGINKFREFEISLPKELTNTENEKLIKDFSESVFGEDFIYTYAVHEKHRGTSNPHAHVMFSEKRADKEYTKELFFAHANKPGAAKKEREWQKKSKLKELRKEWEVFLNLELEKRGIERVSCLSLKDQKMIAELNGEYEKAATFDREPINIDGYILYKKEHELTDEEIKKKEDYLIDKEIRNLKEEMKQKEINLNEFKEKYRLYKEWVLNNKDLTDLIDKKIEINNKIHNINKKKKTENIKATVFNQMTKNEYYKYVNDNRKITKNLKKEKELNKKKALEIRRSKNNEKLKELENNILNNKKLKKQFEYRVDSIKKKYEKNIEAEYKRIEDIDNLLQEHKFNFKTDNVGSINHLIYIFEKTGIKEFEKLGEIFENDIKYYKYKLSKNEIDKEILDVISKGKIKEMIEEENKIKDKIKRLENELRGVKIIDKNILKKIENEREKLKNLSVKIEKIFDKSNDKEWKKEKETKKKNYKEKLKKSEKALENWSKLKRIFRGRNKENNNVYGNIDIRELQEIEIER